MTVPFSYEGRIQLNIAGFDRVPIFIPTEELPVAELTTSNITKYVVNETHIIPELARLSNSSVLVLTGTWVRSEYKILAKLTSYFGPNFDHYTNLTERIITAKIVETKIENVDYFYRGPTTEPPVIITKSPPANTTPKPRSQGLYPAFNPYFYFACFIFFSLLAIVVFDIVRTLLKERRHNFTQINS